MSSNVDLLQYAGTSGAQLCFGIHLIVVRPAAAALRCLCGGNGHRNAREILPCKALAFALCHSHLGYDANSGKVMLPHGLEFLFARFIEVQGHLGIQTLAHQLLAAGRLQCLIDIHTQGNDLIPLRSFSS